MLIDEFDRVLKESQALPQREGFYASDLGKCPRWLAYELREDIPKKPLTAQKIRIYRAGKEFEENLEEELKALGWNYEREVPFEKGIISGRADFLLKDPFETILEAKTIHPYFWQKLKTPLIEHILQLCFYLSCAKLEIGFLIYENKGSQERKEFLVKLSDYEEELESAIKKIEELAQTDFYQELPERAYPKSDWHCKTCDYFETCWQDFEEEIPETPEEIEELAKEYLLAKEEEKELSQRIEDLQTKLHTYFQKTNRGELETELGKIIRQERVITSFKPEVLRNYLEPLGLWEKVIKVDNQALRGILEKGIISEKDLEGAKERKIVYALVIEKPEEKE